MQPEWARENVGTVAPCGLRQAVHQGMNYEKKIMVMICFTCIQNACLVNDTKTVLNRCFDQPDCHRWWEDALAGKGSLAPELAARKSRGSYRVVYLGLLWGS